MNNPMPCVTTVMPSFEHSHVSRRALDSLLAQRLEQWAPAIVEAGSAPGTACVVEAFLDTVGARAGAAPARRGEGA